MTSDVEAEVGDRPPRGRDRVLAARPCRARGGQGVVQPVADRVLTPDAPVSVDVPDADGVVRIPAEIVAFADLERSVPVPEVALGVSACERVRQLVRDAL